MKYVDTNYLLRFFLKDVSSQHDEAKETLLKASKGVLDLFTSTIVWFEIYWVLTSFYQKTREETIEVLEGVLLMIFLEINERDILKMTLDIFKIHNLSLEDCYHLAYARSKRAQDILTFDKRLKRKF